MNGAGSILVVDDDENVRSALRRELRRLGYACDAAADGKEALQKLREHDYHVVLSDLRMPVMGGMALLEAMEEAAVDTVPIILSGAGQIAEAVEATRHGAFDFMEKPAGADRIARTVGRAMKQHAAVRQARAMAELAECWAATFDASPDMILVLDAAGLITQVNQSTARWLHATKEELVGRLCHSAVCGDDHDIERCPLHQSLGASRGRCFEMSQVSQERWLEISSAPVIRPDGRSLGLMHVVRDVTARKRVEIVLREARAQSELIVRSISSILICLDAQTTVRQWNDSAARAIGVSAEEAVGSKLSRCPVSWDFEPIEAALSQCLNTGAPVRVDDIPFRRPDNTDGFLAITLNPMKAGDRSIGVLILGRDITERKALEGQLVQSQRLESIGQLAAGIAHEINTPMQYVGDNTRFLDETFSDLIDLVRQYRKALADAAQGALTPEAVQQMEQAAESADIEYLTEEIPSAIRQSLDGVSRVSKIVKAMRDFSHPGVEEKVAVDINQTIESTITVCRNEWKYVAEMETDFSPDLPAVPCFPGELNQVVLNLIVNAAHAIAAVVGDGSEEKGTIRVRTLQNGDWAEVQVLDTGCGIPEEIRRRVWEPFFTTKEVGKGTGQGLAFAQSVIVNKHGGRISLESEVGSGTTFTIQLPILECPVDPTPQPTEPIHAS